MNNAVMMDTSLWEYQLDIQKQTWVKKFNQDYDALFHKDKVEELREHTIKFEAAIQKVIDDGDSHLDNQGTGLRFTGQLLIWLFHDYGILIHSHLSTREWLQRSFDFMEKNLPYLIEEGKRDGSCLHMILYATHGYQSFGYDDKAWEYFQLGERLFNDPEYKAENQDWVCGRWGTSFGGRPDMITETTPESAKIASIYTAKANLAADFLRIREAKMPEYEDKKWFYVDMWCDSFLECLRVPNYNPGNSPITQHALPARFSFFEKIFADLWYHPTMHPLDKMLRHYKMHKAWEVSTRYNNDCCQPHNHDIIDTRNNPEIMYAATQWYAHTLLHQLSVSGSVKKMNEVLAEMEKQECLDELLKHVAKELESIQDIVSLVDDFVSFYNNVIKLENDKVTAMVANKLAETGFPRLCEELQKTIQDKSLITPVKKDAFSKCLVLTKTVRKGVKSPILFVSDIANFVVDCSFDNGDDEKVLQVEFKKHFGTVDITTEGPVVVKIGFDKAFVTVQGGD